MTDGPVDTGRIGQQVATSLSRLGLPDPVVNVCAAAALERTATGKLRRFVPLPPGPLQADGSTGTGV